MKSGGKKKPRALCNNDDGFCVLYQFLLPDVIFIMGSNVGKRKKKKKINTKRFEVEIVYIGGY